MSAIREAPVAERLDLLLDAPHVAGDLGDRRGGLTPELRNRYGGDLWIPLRADGPTVLANFVETIDGVVAMDTHGRTGGREVSGSNPTDRFAMGLLRSLADVVLVGSSAVRASGSGARTPANVFPAAAPLYGELRQALGLSPAPITLVVTRSGDIDPGSRLFAEDQGPVVIAAPPAVIKRLADLPFGGHVRLRPLRTDVLPGAAIVDVAWGLGARVVVSEAGPHVFGLLAGEGLVDELFVTIAPQLAGRNEAPRMAMVEGVALWPAAPQWARLVSARRASDHLFLRYELKERA